MAPLLGTLRRRVAVTFAAVGLLICLAFALSAYELTRSLLLDQRENTALRRAYVDANFLRAQLSTAGVSPAEAIDALAPPARTAVLVEQGGRWFSSSLGVGRTAVPPSLRSPATVLTSAPTAAYQRTLMAGEPHVVVAVPLPAISGVMYEITALGELRSTLRTFATVLGAGVLAGGLLAAFAGTRLARTVVRPLRPLSETAAAIAVGDLERRLPATADPDLAAIVGSFNSMVDTLAQRIEREVRFTADVSHELRSPLTSLAAGVQLLDARRESLDSRSQELLAVLQQEISRMQGLVEDLLELARRDAGLALDLTSIDVVRLVAETLRASNRDLSLLTVEGADPCAVHADKRGLQRAVLNLLDNADRHGNGVVAVAVGQTGDRVTITVDDAGPGVPATSRDRVFDRFATAGTSRRSAGGAGLGLALVLETVAAHDGTVSCLDRPGGGARFILSLPATT